MSQIGFLNVVRQVWTCLIAEAFILFSAHNKSFHGSV